ncbi:DNA-binding transcriptional MerR regulator [Rhodococcus sp. LBL1]|nr:DNA-binding transcriptional MerR regulator [Rhodococcus sp. LBL1]MDH6685865.1 DNA-binding transcriptional MerR regulator [Rhodococcus sp. LBL2]
MKEYRIDDLAREAGVSVRNVRVYQDRGLLPPPRREGRAGWYNESHLARLNLIGRMLDRGYTFATISELLTAAQYGLQVRDVLETDDPGGRWKKYRRAAKLTMSELRRMFGDQTTEANIALGTQLGVLAKAGKDYSVANPRLMEAAQVLVDAGFRYPTSSSRPRRCAAIWATSPHDSSNSSRTATSRPRAERSSSTRRRCRRLRPW